jgi:hypothetical protein
VINHGQARALLAAVRKERSAPPLVAFFAVMHYAALRPGDAVELRKDALSIPRSGWGELYLSTSAPSAGRSWSEPVLVVSLASSSTAASTKFASSRVHRS